ncbi:hypothetical protein NLU13_9930 [Sarocladium strictum]|uniref:Uncharacterized protein n=1 Tax=Sarocladium strictum TaxID=5046 RepID=A0AA39L3P5_SARSR|nr:hypothetical protein NLU13_9930 [Sarocladium strictum]
MLRAFSQSRQQQQAPTIISAPIGPVRSSRGVDLIRSDTLIIVPGIEDGANKTQDVRRRLPTDLKGSELLVPKAFGFAALVPARNLPNVVEDGKSSSLIGRQIVANRRLAARTETKLHAVKHKQIMTPKVGSLKPSFSVPLLEPLQSPKSSSSTLINCESRVQDENIPPPNHTGSTVNCQDSLPKVTSRIPKLPKSRTMGVLHELRASISRPRTVSGRTRRSSRLLSPRVDSSPFTDSVKSYVHESSASSKSWLPHTSLTSLVRTSQSCTPEPLRPDQVVGSQPSAYWSGRFLSLHDRFLNEAQDSLASSKPCTTSKNPPKAKGASLKARTGGNHSLGGTRISSTASQLPFSNNTNLPHANTTSSLSKISFRPSPTPTPNEDDSRCRRIFNRLEESCLTQEALQSLQDWQHAYARKENRPSLLPIGRVMNEKGRVAKLFGGSTMGKKAKPQRRCVD